MLHGLARALLMAATFAFGKMGSMMDVNFHQLVYKWQYELPRQKILYSVLLDSFLADPLYAAYKPFAAVLRMLLDPPKVVGSHVRLCMFWNVICDHVLAFYPRSCHLFFFCSRAFSLLVYVVS